MFPKVMKLMQRVNRLYDFIRSSPSSKIRLILFYRYGSLILTSLFFLLGPQSPFIFKVGVIASLCIAAWIVTDLQRRYVDHNKVLKLIVLVETVGLTLLLIPTGGIASPFIWYALNPVLAAAIFLTPLFCWIALTFYLGSATLIAYYVFQIDSIVMVLGGHSYFYLVCVLTTLLASLFSQLTNELNSKTTVLLEQHNELLIVNKKLIETNQKYENTLDHIMSLYHLIDNFSTKKGAEKLTEEITKSLLVCTQSDAAFFWLTDLNHQNSHLEATMSNPDMEKELKQKWKNIRGRREPFAEKVDDELYWMKIIRTSNNVGVMGVKITSSNEDSMSSLMKRTFAFLIELSEIMLERIYMDQMMDQMIIVEEQNRIANEIHDSVSQRLFGIVYSLHGLQVKSRTMTPEQLNEEYQFLSQSANTTIKELRAAIYRLSSLKKGEKPFLARIKTYLDEYAKLNDIQIDYQISGDESFIPHELKQGLYRIISEACGNSVRHGQCHVIDLKFSLLDDKIILLIQDDGIGINSQDNRGEKMTGIGLINMKRIISSFNGTFLIDGMEGAGTVIQIEIPYIKMLIKQEVVGR